MAVCDAVAKLPYTDSARMVAAGGSYGGYLRGLILGQRSASKRSFRMPAFTTCAAKP
jgi:dipeptidyl aminopeptidase/acylaminoacyl peptidase